MRVFRSLLACLLIAFPVHAAEKVRVAIGTGDQNTYDIYEEITREAYGRAGLQVEILKAPGYNSLNLVQNGHADAIAVRVEELAGLADGILQVPVVIGSLKVAAIAPEGSAPIQSADDLQKYRVGSTTNFQFMAELFPFQRIVWLNDLTGLMRKLDLGQLDYALYLPQIFHQVAHKKYPEKKYSYSILRSRNLFHYVSEKRKDLRQPLEKAFQSLVDDGYILKTLRKYGFKVDDSFLKRVH